MMTRITLPAGRENAIARVIFTVHLDGELGDSEVHKIDENYPTFKDDLPRRSVDHGLLVRVSPHGPTEAEPVQTPSLSRVTYEALRRDGSIERGIRIERNAIQLLSTEYTSWSEIWPMVERLFFLVLGPILGPYKITAIETRYVDEFLYHGPYNEFRAEELFDKDSVYLPQHIFTQTLNWHVHTGWFERHGAPLVHRALHNIDVDVLDGHQSTTDEAVRVARISFLHRLEPENPIGVEVLADDENNPRLVTLYRSLHDQNKRVMRNLVKNEIAEWVGLE